MYICTTYKQVELAGISFFQLIFCFEFSNFLLLRLEIQGKGSIVHFSFVVELNGMGHGFGFIA